MRAPLAAASAATTAGSEARPNSASPGNAARSMSSARAPRAASRASAYSTSTRDLEVAAGLPDSPLIWVAKAGTIPFFIIHYGLFTTVHGVFVLTLFGGVHERGFPGPTEFFHAVRAAGIWPAALVLAASHGVSFAFNYIGGGEYRTAALAGLMGRAYGP